MLTELTVFPSLQTGSLYCAPQEWDKAGFMQSFFSPPAPAPLAFFTSDYQLQ